ncbi:MAG TPA: phage holin family protein [Steroidobacter sp.]|jgi:O-antigen ligase|nr:phage holin family protein [Steroidobacteraceae bacterium]HLS82101.1 phage holin family protein [Steroidobacter sp.]
MVAQMSDRGPARAPRGSLEQESAAGLLSRLFNDATALFRNEIALAKAEARKAFANVKAGVGAIAIGGAVLLVGALALAAALILGLAEMMAPWLAALLVGVAFAIVGAVLITMAKKKLEPRNLALERTQSSLKRDAEVVTRRT